MKRIVVPLIAALMTSACGDATFEIEGDGPDPERLGDSAESAEAALRASPKYDAEFAAAGAEFGVPPALLKALAYTQTRYEMVEGAAEFEGRAPTFGVMGLSDAALLQGAGLAAVSADEAKTDARHNIRAAAALLKSYAEELAIDRSEVPAWAPVVKRFSGIEDADAAEDFVRSEVFMALKAGVGKPTEELKARGISVELALPQLGTMAQELSSGPNYPGAIYRQSPNQNARPSGVKPLLLVIHTCEGNYAGCWGWLRNPAAGASAHYVVNTTGSEITQLVPESHRAWHASANYSCSNVGGHDCALNGRSVNDISIGIEHAGFASQQSFPVGQIDASARLACDITRDNAIPRDRYHVVSHGQLQPYNRTDPGPRWPWSDYMNRMVSHCGGSAGGGGGGGGGGTTTPPATTFSPIVIDSNNGNNNKARGYIQVSANWTGTAATGGFYGSGYYYATTAPVSDGATFWFYLPAASTRGVDAWWTAGANRAAAAPFVAFNAQGAKVGTGSANQRLNGGKWNAVGTFAFTAGWNKIVLSRWTAEGSVVIADAVRVR